MKNILTLLLPYILLLLACAGVWPIKSHMEAKAYNRITGANVTTWEAMFLNLRVDLPPTGARRVLQNSK